MLSAQMNSCQRGSTLVSHGRPARELHTKTHLELDRSTLVLVKHPEDEFCKLGRVAEREELLVDLLELLLVELAGRAVLKEALVPAQPLPTSSAPGQETWERKETNHC